MDQSGLSSYKLAHPGPPPKFVWQQLDAPALTSLPHQRTIIIRMQSLIKTA
jgi:hypothetical protein